MARIPINQQVRTTALSILEKEPEGLRFSELMDRVGDQLPEVQKNTLATMIVDRVGKDPAVDRSVRGHYRLSKYKAAEGKVVPPKLPAILDPETGKIRAVQTGSETLFYEPFRLWLESDVQDCTKAIVVGGNRFGSKWGTPDVVGVWKPERDDIIKLPEEIVSAEIKTDTTGLITAFGQACAYKLFSHRTYIVVPRSSSKVDLERLESLCQITGIGLVIFDVSNPDRPAFQIRTRPVRHDPDVFYMNEAAKNFKELF
ncbi:MAG: hypothetical protein ABR586_05890 [Thermoplasmatota archaeon]